MKAYSIYVLINPTTNSIFYVGKTDQRLETRLGSHLYEYSNPKNTRSPKTEILIEILEAGQMPLIRKVDSAYGLNEALVLEKFWIYELHKSGNPITNREVMPRPRYDVFFTPNFPYGVSVKRGAEVPITILMYSKSGSKYFPANPINKDRPEYIEVPDSDYYGGLCSRLKNIYKSVNKSILQ